MNGRASDQTGRSNAESPRQASPRAPGRLPDEGGRLRGPTRRLPSREPSKQGPSGQDGRAWRGRQARQVREAYASRTAAAERADRGSPKKRSSVSGGSLKPTSSASVEATNSMSADRGPLGRLLLLISVAQDSGDRRFDFRSPPLDRPLDRLLPWLPRVRPGRFAAAPSRAFCALPFGCLDVLPAPVAALRTVLPAP